MTLLARRYATALHLAARQRGSVAEVEQDLAGLHEVLADPAVRALLLSPDVRGAERAALVDKLGEGASDLVRNLLHVVLRRRRQRVLFDLQPAFRALVRAERGEAEGEVETPRPLGEHDLQRLAELGAALSGQRVDFSVRVRPELIGGVRLRIGNVLYDGSVQSALDQLEQKLLQVTV